MVRTATALDPHRCPVAVFGAILLLRPDAPGRTITLERAESGALPGGALAFEVAGVFPDCPRQGLLVLDALPSSDPARGYLWAAWAHAARWGRGVQLQPTWLGAVEGSGGQLVLLHPPALPPVGTEPDIALLAPLPVVTQGT